MKSVSFDKIKLGGFWKDRFETNRVSTIPSVFDRFSDTGRFKAFECNWKEGDPLKPHFFWDSDVAKWLEGAAYSIALSPDKELEKKIDDVVDLIEKNQGEDGYFNIYFTVVAPEKRFSNRDCHELYCAGHLTEAAVAYYNATGKDKFLNLMRKYIDYIYQVFYVEDSAAFSTPGHEEIELALIKLYDCTGDKKYLDLSAHFINTRGTSDKDSGIPEWATQLYFQSDEPVRDFVRAKGHSVRACYLYSGMADLAAKTGDKELLDACRRVFDNIAEKQMYITGGIGATNQGEAFTEDYLLPNDLAYSETCASIALAMFAKRMSAIEPDSKYDDVAEAAIYNCILSGVSLDGKSFFYVNPLEINVRKFNQYKKWYKSSQNLLTQRIEVFGCSCCPPNIVRFIPSIGDYIYTYNDSTVYVHHYIESEAEFDGVSIIQKTEYPNEGDIKFTVKGMAGDNLALRIPGWCDYFTVNGKPFTGEIKNGYAFIAIEEDEQNIELYLDMEPRLVSANPEVEADIGRVAVCRGPIVYCAEEIDNGNVSLNNLSIDSNFEPEIRFNHDFNAYVIETNGFEDAPSEKLYSAYDPNAVTERKLRFIPYFAFANRGESDMLIWFRIR